MNRAAHIITAALMWCAIAAYVVMASSHARERRAAINVKELRITVTGGAQNNTQSSLQIDSARTAATQATAVITPEKVSKWLSEAGIDPIGQSIDEADTRAIERQIASHPEVRRAAARSDLDGTLTVRVEPRTPAMRVLTSNGYRFWLTGDGVILPDEGDYTAYVPIVTGNIAFPFAPSARGSYLKMQADNYNDFLGRFTALETERRTLSARSGAIRTDLRTARASTSKRWWGRYRRENFAATKAARIAELERERDELSAALSSLAQLERSLREKEKKSYQSYRFLSKLANFVEFIGRDDFWASQIVQIDAVDGKGGTDAAGRTGPGGTDTAPWHEPQLELIPRAGDHVVLLGELDGTERRRLENLRLFYLKGLWHEGWSEYGHINIKYDNQIVCTK